MAAPGLCVNCLADWFIGLGSSSLQRWVISLAGIRLFGEVVVQRITCSLFWEFAGWVLRSTITSRGQTVFPTAIRERFDLGLSQRLEWLVEEDGSIRVVPVAASPVQVFRRQGRAGGSTARLLADRQLDRNA